LATIEYTSEIIVIIIRLEMEKSMVKEILEGYQADE